MTVDSASSIAHAFRVPLLEIAAYLGAAAFVSFIWFMQTQQTFWSSLWVSLFKLPLFAFALGLAIATLEVAVVCLFSNGSIILLWFGLLSGAIAFLFSLGFVVYDFMRQPALTAAPTNARDLHEQRVAKVGAGCVGLSITTGIYTSSVAMWVI